jgi:hypothetical protein
MVLALMTISSAALAGPQCTTQPATEWLPAEEMKNKIVAMGHKIDVFKTTKGNCYEIYGKDNAGRLIEIYFNPVTGEIVRQASQ